MGDSQWNSIHRAPNVHNRSPYQASFNQNKHNQDDIPVFMRSNMPILAPNFQNPLMGHFLRPNVAMVNCLDNIRPNLPVYGHGGLIGLPLPRPQSRPPLRHHHHFGGSGSPRMQSHAPPIACHVPPSPLPPSSSPLQTQNLMSGCFSFYRRRNHHRSSWGGGTGFFLPRVTSSSDGSSSGRTERGKAPAVPLPPPAASSARCRGGNKKKDLAEVSKNEDLAHVEEQDKSELSPEDFLPKEWEY